MYTNLGILHIISVSGFHIILIESFILFLLGFININKNIKKMFVLILIFIYCLIIDFPPSALRAFIFLLTSFLSSIFHLPKINIKTLSVSAIIILLISPTSILDIGFQFSFLATLGIVFIYPLLIKRNRKGFTILNALQLTVIINILLFPLQIYYFNKIQLATLLGNLLAIPLLTCIIYMSVFLIIFTKVYIINSLISKIISIVYMIETYLLQGINNLFKTVNLTFNLEDIITMYLIIFLFLFIYSIRNELRVNSNKVKRIIYIFIPIFLIYSVFQFNNSSMLKVTAINVGQGDCFLFESPNYNILLDTGGSFRKDNSFNKLNSYLNYKKIKELDAVFLSHFDEDHAGNIDSIIKKYGEIPVYSRIDGRKNFTDKYNINKNLYREIREGKDIIKFDNISMSFFNANNNSDNENNNSIVIILNVFNDKILFTGDIPIDIEEKIKNEDIDSDIIKIPHHGSKTSSSEEFIARVDPSFAILSVGENNSYNLPNDEVIKRYIDRGTKIFRTDYDGAIFIEFNECDINIYTKKDIFFKNLFSVKVYNYLVFSTLILVIIYYVSRYDYDKIK